MRALTLIPIAALAIPIASCGQPSRPDIPTPPRASSRLPPQIRPITGLIQGKSPDEIRQIMIKHFGPVHRIVGSGFRIEQWDVANGMLTFHPAIGPSYTPEGQTTMHLLATHNPVRKNLLGSYEMVSLAADDPNSVSYWLGNLQIEPDGSYSFKDSGQFPTKSARQSNNFFYLHPVGTVEIQYAAGVSAETLLETLPTESDVAQLHFRAADGHAKQTFSIKTQESARRLMFVGFDPLSFEMDKGWESLWK
jgi:hypothetical protein